MLFGCEMPVQDISVEEASTSASDSETTEESTFSSETSAQPYETTIASTEETVPAVVTNRETTSVVTTEAITINAPVSESFDYNTIPAYNGSPYCEVNGNIPFFEEEDFTADSYEYYSPLDDLGRCGVCISSIGKDLMPTGQRGEIGSVRPSGFHLVRYDDVITDKYLYNRCHLIGWQLTGENANERNLITGTRYLNVEGMLPYENKTAKYIRNTGNHVLYRVTPVFIGSELLCRGVLMEAQSVEDDGAGVKFNVFCYNVQPKIFIDYQTGDSHLLEDAVIPVTTSTDITLDAGTTSVITSDAPTYILNTNSYKFHDPSCDSVLSMKDKNKQEYYGARDDVIAMGYVPCQRCNP